MKKFLSTRQLFLGLLLCGSSMALFLPLHAQAQSPTQDEAPIKAIITKVVTSGQNVTYTLKLHSGQAVTTGEEQSLTDTSHPPYRKGDHIYAQAIGKADGGTSYVVVDYDRGGSLWWLVVGFILAIIWFSRWRGVRSLIGLGLSFVMIIGWVVPHIAKGGNPVTTTLLGSAVILCVNFALTEGFSRLMWASTLGTVITMVATGLLSIFAIHFTHLTGTGTDEAFSLQSLGINVDLRGLLLAGVIVGTLGLLNDVAVGQAATVGELRRANPRMPDRELYRSAMHVGQVHLSAIINTLILAYAGSALPLLVLFSANPQPLGATISSELIAAEIVRSVVGSVGLLLAVPITTAIAMWLRVRSTGGHNHPHEHPSAN